MFQPIVIIRDGCSIPDNDHWSKHVGQGLFVVKSVPSTSHLVCGTHTGSKQEVRSVVATLDLLDIEPHWMLASIFLMWVRTWKCFYFNYCNKYHCTMAFYFTVYSWWKNCIWRIKRCKDQKQHERWADAALSGAASCPVCGWNVTHTHCPLAIDEACHLWLHPPPRAWCTLVNVVSWCQILGHAR